MRPPTILTGPGRAAEEKKKGLAMNEKKSPLWRLVAGMGAFSLAVAGFTGVGTANADDPEPGTLSPGNIQGTEGTLHIHKFGGDPVGGRDDGTEIENTSGLGTPLNDVEFTVCEVRLDGAAIELTTFEGWETVQNAALEAGALPEGFTTGDCVTVVTQNGVASTDLDLGLYLVTETDPGENQIVSPVVPFLVTIPFPAANQWLYNVHVYPKNKLNETTPEKTVADPGAVLVVGSEVVWTITAPVPELAAGDSYRSFVITDKLDSRLSVDLNEVIVQLDDGDPLEAPSGYTITEEDGLVTITLTAETRATLAGGTNVIVTLPTTVDSLGEDAEFANEALVNVNGSERTTGKPTVYWGSIEVLKVNAADTDQTLAGAEFELYATQDAAEPLAGPVATAADGTLRFDGLWVGLASDATREYYLKETKAPAGYVTPTGDAAWTTVNVTADGLTTVAKTTVKNTKQEGPGLPLTGGAGTATFSLAGLLLIGLAAYGLFFRRKSTTVKS